MYYLSSYFCKNLISRPILIANTLVTIRVSVTEILIMSPAYGDGDRETFFGADPIGVSFSVGVTLFGIGVGGTLSCLQDIL